MTERKIVIIIDSGMTVRAFSTVKKYEQWIKGNNHYLDNPEVQIELWDYNGDFECYRKKAQF